MLSKFKKMKKFWKKVFIASITSGASVQKAKLKADEAVKLLERLERNETIEEPEISLNTPFHDITTTQTANALRAADYNRVEDLQGIQLKELKTLRNFGEKAMNEVLDICEKLTGKRFTLHQTVDLL